MSTARETSLTGDSMTADQLRLGSAAKGIAMIGRNGVWTRTSHVYVAAGLLAIASSYYVDLPVPVTGAFLFLLAIVRLSDLMRSRQTERALARHFHEVVTAAEEERIRVAGMLHDGPIQQLTALGLTLDLTSMQLDRGDVSALRSSVAKARQTAADQMLALRQLMIELRPPALDEIGLEGVLRDYTSDLDRRGGVSVDFVGKVGERRFGAAVETTLYRVAQEALTHVAKDGRAGHAQVRLTCDSHAVRLRVEDDGVGFEEQPSSELTRAGDPGLVAMRGRVERAGGEWRSSSGAGAGTVIDATLPIVAPLAAAPETRSS